MSDNFQFLLKNAGLFIKVLAALLGAGDGASISLMDRLSYSDSAVLLLVYRRLRTPDARVRAIVFLSYRSLLLSASRHKHKQPAREE